MRKKNLVSFQILPLLAQNLGPKYFVVDLTSTRKKLHSCKLSLYANSKKTDEPKTWEKGKKICNLRHNILQLSNVLIQIRLSTIKRNVTSSKGNLVYELPNDLRLRIFGNKEILGKSQTWMQTQRSTKSPF